LTLPAASATPAPGLGTTVGQTFLPGTPRSVDGLVARLITSATDSQILSYVRTTDARTALARGLQEYLQTLQIIWEGGRLVAFRDVKVAWASVEDPTVYPSAVLVGAEPATYEANSFVPQLVRVQEGENSRYIRQASEMMQSFQLILWTTDPVERMALTAMVEDALSPAEFMYGLRLELPYYWNVRATYSPLSVIYDDNAADAQRRWRRAVITVTGHIPQMRPVGHLVNMRPLGVVISSTELSEDN